jgi:hypothetical protein
MKRPQRKASPKPNAVRVREEWLTLPTYEPAAPDKNPMFLERRVYQGSSGKVYPLPFTDRIPDPAGKESHGWHRSPDALRGFG